MDIFDKTRKLTQWLTGREFFCPELDYALQEYEREVEKVRIHAVNRLLVKLDSIKREALNDASDMSFSKRERGKAQTEVNRIQAEMERLMATVPYEKLITLYS